jgi:hypothetical protein
VKAQPLRPSQQKFSAMAIASDRQRRQKIREGFLLPCFTLSKTA